MKMTDDVEKKLLTLCNRLNGEQQQALLSYAEFLAGRAPAGQAPYVMAAIPRPKPKPENESVVMAIKRLTRVYPMLDRRKLMGPTSMLMSQHALQGRPATEVIAELEIIFERHFRESNGDV